MSKGMWKTTLREIRSSLGRYLAIFLIVALGVGFFAGLKVTHQVMLYTADTYLSKLQFYDLRLVSTLGFSGEDAQQLQKEEDVAAAEGSKSVDVIMAGEDGSEFVAKTIELPDRINLVNLEQGRMPENENECIVDSHWYGAENIGQNIVISENNEKDDRDKFSVKEYTVVGIASSPLYVRYDRGNTSIGDGVIDAFVYLKEAAYDMDYDTEIYVTFQKEAYNGDDAISIYSDAYRDFIDGKQEQWKSITQDIANARYEDVYGEASEELADARKQFEQEKKDGEQKLADAKQELESARQQLTDGATALSDAKQQIHEKEQQLEDSEQTYQKGLQDYEKGKKQYDSGKEQYDQAKMQYEEMYAAKYPEYQKGCEQLEAAKAAYEESKASYEKALKAYEDGKSILTEDEQAQKEAEFVTWQQTLTQTEQSLEASRQQLDAVKASFDAGKERLETSKQQLTAAKEKLQRAKKKLDDAKQKLADGKQQLQTAKDTISGKEEELANAKADLLDGEQEYEKGKREFEDEIAKAEQELEDGQLQLEDIAVPTTYVLDRDTNSGYVSFETDSQIVMGVANVFPVFFFLVAALVCITTMTRMVEEQRTQVGVLKALGYSDGAIIGKYMVYSVSAALLGAVFGFFVGTYAFPGVIWIAYKMLYNMGSSYYVFDKNLALIGLVVAFLCSGGTTMICCYQELRQMAATLMRPKAPRVGKRVFLERIPFLWRRLKFLDKVSVRNLFRYKKRFFMMIIGVSGCTALLVAAFGIRDSVSRIAQKQFGEIFLYDLSATLKEDAKESSFDVDGIQEQLLVYEKKVDFSADGRETSTYLLVPEDEKFFDHYMHLMDDDEEDMTFPERGEVYITQKLAQTYDLKPGDPIQIGNGEGKQREAVIGGVFRNYFNLYVLLSEETYQDLFEEPVSYNTELINVAPNVDVHEVGAQLMKESDVASVSISEDIRQNVADMMKSLNYVVFLVIGCAAALAFIVIYNLNNINITERVREIATIKVLGFYKEETRSYIFRENIVLTLLGSLVGLVLGHFLHAFIMSEINLDAISFDVRVRTISYLYSIVGTLLFNGIVNLFMTKKLEAIHMAESLKSVD